MSSYRKKPVVIDAVQWDGVNIDPLWDMPGTSAQPFTLDGNGGVMIHTLEGTMRADPGDWVIRGVKGEFYPCKPDIFEATYERHLEDDEVACEGCDVTLKADKANYDSKGVVLCDTCWEELTGQGQAEHVPGGSE